MSKEQNNLLSELQARLKLLRKVASLFDKLQELYEAARAARETASNTAVLDLENLEPEGFALESDDDVTIIEAFDAKPTKVTGQLLAKALFPDELFTALDEYAKAVNAWQKGVSKLGEAVREVLELDARILEPLNEDDAELVRDRLIQTDFPLCSDADDVVLACRESNVPKLDLDYVKSLYEEQE